MKTRLVFLIGSIMLILMSGCRNQKSNYPNNLEPLVKTTYIKLPLGDVKPAGWLRDQLQVQSDGLTSNLPLIWDVVKTSSWKGDTGMNVTPECCTARFVPRWLEGLLPLAIQLDDKKLMNMVNEYMSYILKVDNLPIVTTSLVGWSHLGRVLPEYYEVTKDKRAIDLCRKILVFADSARNNPKIGVVTPKRLGMLMSFSWWYYNMTGDRSIFPLLDSCAKPSADEWCDYFSNFSEHDRTGMPDFPLSPGDMGRHGVDVAQAIQYTVMYYLYSGDTKYRDCVFKGMESLDKFNGQVGGRWNADEYLAGLSPTQGTELCDITELIYSLVKDFEAIGDVRFSDRMEQLMFNGLPGTCTGDMWSHQYDQQANQVLVSDDERPWKKNTRTSNIFGFTPHFPCCLSNLHSAFPRYVSYMWMATNDRGLITHLYGPSEVKAIVANHKEVIIKEITDYPFSDSIKFVITCEGDIDFPLYLRIPSWADNARLRVNDEPETGNSPGAFVKLERSWSNGDVISLSLNNKVRTERRLNNSVSIVWGPLWFSLKIGESFKQIRIKEDRRVENINPTGSVNWAIEPTAPWNYGLYINPEMPEYEMVRNKIGHYPFVRKGEPVWLPGATDFVTWDEDPPVILKMKAKLVPEWVMSGASAGPVPLSPLKVDTREEIVELVPYGSTRLRISEFPLVSNQ